jgi:heme ABC exporter ATP-binding subunit CcmA
MDRVIDVLRRAPLFASLDAGQLEALAGAAATRTARQGETIIAEGEPGDEMYIIAAGQVRVAPSADSRTVLARLGPGEFFGEMALLDHVPRSAAVVAERETALVALSRETLAHLGAAHAGLAEHLAMVIRARRTRGATPADEAVTICALPAAGRTVSLGRGSDADVALDDPTVAVRHAEILGEGDAWTVIDRSGGRTFVNGAAVARTSLGDGDELRLGRSRLFLHRGVLKLFVGSAGVRVECNGLTVQRGNRAILSQVSLAISPGELVAIVGPSGAGKTTLLRALLGLNAPTAGEVRYDGLDLHTHQDAFRAVLGYVPQDDIVHADLTLVESLSYAARLRLPADTSVAERRQRIARVLEQLALGREANQLVRELSGGQRKRASIALELLTEPRLLFMDEPTSGLDPARDERLMEVFRSLADQGRTVVLTTHATRNIHLCDRLVVLSEGRLAFTGTPDEALRYFGVDEFAHIYPQLEQGDAAHLSELLRGSAIYQAGVADRLLSPDGQPAALTAEGGRRRAPARAMRQLWPLTLRSLRLASRDRVNMTLRLAGPPLLAGSLVLTFDWDLFALTTEEGGKAISAITLLYLLGAISLFLGAFTSANAITGEAAIFRRERLVDLSPTAYVLAKALVLAAFSTVQSALLVGTLAIFIELPEPQARVTLQLFLATTLTAIAGMGMGLFVSSLSPNSDRAAILVVLLLIPQLIFAGSTVPRRDMRDPALLISDATVSKWSLELMGGITDIRTREAKQAFAETTPFPEAPAVLVQIPDDKRPFMTAFHNDPNARWYVLGGFVVLFTGATLVVQSLKGRARPRWSYRRQALSPARDPGVA